MVRTPTALPVLSAGRHRGPRQGACLMEYASVLAGERFSDAPRCTDPVLGAVARAVNDYSSDVARQRLAPLAGDLTTACGGGDDIRRGIIRRCLLTALRYVNGRRRQVLVVGLLGLERADAGIDRGWDTTMLSLDSELALLGHDGDIDAAVDYVANLPVSVGEHARRGLSVAAEVAVSAIKDSAPEPDDVLHDLLVECIRDYNAAVTGRQPSKLAWSVDSTS